MNKQKELFSNEEEIAVLTDKLLQYQYEYYVLNKPSVSDKKYDEYFDRLVYLESIYPEINNENSPVKRIGSDLTKELPETAHTIPVLSLDKVYNISKLYEWIEKIEKNTGSRQVFTIEEKIDGVTIVLYYKNGSLQKAVTRGNGYSGNDVTDNVKTIGAVPLKLKKNVTIAVRGEIYLPLHYFSELNKKLDQMYANPRNLAAGTIRRIKSSDVKKIPLNIYIYEGYPEDNSIKSHIDLLLYLEELGFRINKTIMAFTDSNNDYDRIKNLVKAGRLKDISSYIENRTEERKTLGYEIDGLVIKLDNISDREKIGFTDHHPRWATAYKFISSEAESRIISIDVQTGRTGRITPVARIEPVLINGSTISNVTLHNQDYINFLCLSPGDRVTVSKRGDVIPAIENVIEKHDLNAETWKMPQTCPSCSSKIESEGAHQFCRNKKCKARIKGQLLYFSSREQMNIENLGLETIELVVQENYIENIADIYTFDFSILEKFDGYGIKKIELIKKSVEKSKIKPYKTVLSSLGLPDAGPKVCSLLIKSGIKSIDTLFAIVRNSEKERLYNIKGIGEKTVESIMKYFSDPETVEIIEKLKKAGLNFSDNTENTDNIYDNSFSNQIWCVTGSFDNFKPRSLAEDEITKRGGTVTSQITGKTTHLLCGESPGSKLSKAGSFNIKIVTEKDFLELLD